MEFTDPDCVEEEKKRPAVNIRGMQKSRCDASEPDPNASGQQWSSECSAADYYYKPSTSSGCLGLSKHNDLI